MGHRVKLLCKSGDLVQLGRVDSHAPVVQAVDIAGLVSAVSDASITVASTDKSRSLTCSVPSRLAETVHALSVGDAVKLLCKKSAAGTELASVARLLVSDKSPEQPKAEWAIAGAISSLSGDRVKLLCRGTDERSAVVAALARL